MKLVPLHGSELIGDISQINTMNESIVRNIMQQFYLTLLRNQGGSVFAGCNRWQAKFCWKVFRISYKIINVLSCYLEMHENVEKIRKK